MTSGKDTGRARAREPAAAASPADPRSKNAQPDPRLADLPARALRRVRRAEVWVNRGELAYADQALAEALRFAPEHAELLRMRALVMHRLKRYDKAIALLRRAIELRPEDVQLYNNLGSALGESGDMNGAVAALEHTCTLEPDQAVPWFNLGKACDQVLRTAEAEQALSRALACRPNYIEAMVLHADILRTLGSIEEATAEFRHALELEPESPEAWAGLIGLKASKPGPEDLATLERMYRRTNDSAETHASIGFTYGLALEASGRHGDAFEAFVAANAARRRKLQWNAANVSHVIDTILDAFAADPPTPPQSDLGSEAVFLVGMPRSGSTLTEQILSAHPEVEGAGEIGDLVAVVRDESTRRGIDFPDWVADATATDWQRLGEDYLQRAGLKRRNEARLFTDKSLLNWQLVGAVRAMLPGAHFIDCRRDPVESCWSCFKHQFGDHQAYTFDFAELAAWWRDYDRSMTFWNQRYPGLVYRHDYEALIAEPEMQIRRLLDHCGLAFDPACLRFHESSRDVRTASAAQVRSPLRSDTAISHHYGALLDPLRSALAATS